MKKQLNKTMQEKIVSRLYDVTIVNCGKQNDKTQTTLRETIEAANIIDAYNKAYDIAIKLNETSAFKFRVYDISYSDNVIGDK